MSPKLAEIIKTLTDEIERLEAENERLRLENEDTPAAKGRRFMNRIEQARVLRQQKPPDS